MTKTRWISVVVVGIGVAAVVLFLFSRPTGNRLPQKIGELALVHQVEGDRADEILNRLHDKEVTPSKNMIGLYAGGPAGAVVYLSIYGLRSDALRAYEKMARRIENGNPIFSGYRSVRIGDTDASFCVGQGQDHYFFVSKDMLYWLAVDTTIADKVAGEFIRSLP
jgi:hypothetical protein